MNEPIQTPPPAQQRSGGCCGMGCATALALLVFLVIALVGGTYFGIRHLQQKYSAAEPVALPEVITTDAPVATETAPAAPSSTVITTTQMREAETQWKSFERAKPREGVAQINLSAGEINALLQSHKNTRGKVFVSIANNVGHVQVSIPLKNVPLMKGRFLNGEATVKASPDGDPFKAQMTDIVLSGNAVDNGVIDQRLFAWSSIRGMITEWMQKQGVTSFRIENDRVLGEKSGGSEFR